MGTNLVRVCLFVTRRCHIQVEWHQRVAQYLDRSDVHGSFYWIAYQDVRKTCLITSIICVLSPDHKNNTMYNILITEQNI